MKLGLKLLQWSALFTSAYADCNEKFTEQVLPDGSCQCKENFYGPTCDGVDYNLVCDQALVSVKVKMSIFESIGIDKAENLHLNDMACEGVAGINEDGEDIVVFSITGSPASCGASVESNGTYIRYSNYISDNDITNDPSLTTRSRVNIGFHCAFPVDYRVALPAIAPTVSTVSFQNSRGQFVVNMDLFGDDTYRNPLSADENVIGKGEWLYLQMALLNQIDGSASNLVAEQCWATPVPQPHSDSPDLESAYHNILLSGCPVDSSVGIAHNGDKEKVQFKVQMFGFKGNNPEVYLHCVVRVCGQNCEKQCGRTRRGAADENMYSDIAVVSSVKIIIDERDEVQVEQIAEIEPFIHTKFDATIIYVLSAILVLVVFAIFAAALMIHQKSRISLLDAESSDSKTAVANKNAGTAFSRLF
ncbi:unnamed protein product [Oikopleura dioica]|uniref:ZP domain-containing protein n=1 Tax=Oikopleura dioica TaxID=34765 RepID=E4X0U3_OIKDI|nr:unnamed protein product [Oikopleura dioica]